LFEQPLKSPASIFGQSAGVLRHRCRSKNERRSGCESKLAKIFAFFSPSIFVHARRVELCWFTDMPTARRKNFRSVAVILFERG
jgi:hypothetical protein